MNNREVIIIEEFITGDIFDIPDVDEAIIDNMKLRLKDAGQE